GDPVEALRPERAALAALLPLRGEHEVVHRQLAPAVEEVGQGLPPLGSVEEVGFLHPQPGERPPLGAQRVTPPGELLLLGEELLARRQPFVPRSSELHRRLLVRWLLTPPGIAAARAPAG